VIWKAHQRNAEDAQAHDRFGSYNDLRSFFTWLAKDTGRGDSIMVSIRVKQPDVADVPVLTPDELRALIGTCKGDGVIALRTGPSFSRSWKPGCAGPSWPPLTSET
jgi:hypothetical protein